MNEEILVVRKELLFPDDSIDGVVDKNIDKYETIINLHGEFKNRSLMEIDNNYKQIIPYIIFKYQKKLFLMQRSKTGNEKRLKSKYTLGIGGHIRKDDIIGRSIFNWAAREFNEEVSYNGSLNIKAKAIINDESNEVGKVHIGLLFLVEGDIEDISIKSELDSGLLIELDKLLEYYNKMERWSQLALNYFMRRNLI